MDDISEDQEIFLVTITDITTVCPFEVPNNVSTVSIRDRESELCI